MQYLEGQVLLLRNEISRQRKLRIATERSLSSNQDRSRRCESLLSEMQADMISLKERLNEDLIELGVDQEKAAEILSEFYSEHFANGSSPSVSRKVSFYRLLLKKYCLTYPFLTYILVIGQHRESMMDMNMSSRPRLICSCEIQSLFIVQVIDAQSLKITMIQLILTMTSAVCKIEVCPRVSYEKEC